MDWTWMGRGLRIGGHRGAPDVAPENTLAGFEAARAIGVDYLEMDVRRSADGVLVLMHDPTVDRTTNGHGAVTDLTLAELQRLDAGRRFDDRFAGQRVPTFEEFMAWIEARAPFGAVIEAKAVGVGAEIAERIARSPAREHLSICSFHPGEILDAKRARAEVPCVLLFHTYHPGGDPLEHIRACHADGADVPWQWLDAELVGRMRAAGMLVGGGTASDERAVQRLLELDADFVDSDRPAVSVAARNAGRPGG